MIVTPTNKSVTELEGLHLFHADISNALDDAASHISKIPNAGNAL